MIHACNQYRRHSRGRISHKDGADDNLETKSCFLSTHAFSLFVRDFLNWLIKVSSMLDVKVKLDLSLE